MTIFVQIASYRDPQLIPTIEDMLQNAKYPENLRLGIARQYHPDDKFDDLSEYENDDRFRILNILYTASTGVCWARNQVQQLYDNETYTLQIDSHMRFTKDWDDTLIRMLKGLQDKGHKKPLLTSYVSSYDPENDPDGRVTEPWRMVFDRFTPEGVVFFLPEVIPNWENLTEPIRARFYSAHFCFTLGEFAKNVQHDPDYYFHGEEISIAVRAFTHGYDLFHPHRIVIYHEYTRKNRTKQWDDDTVWYLKDKSSHEKNRKVLGIDGEKYEGELKYGFGNERTIKDYEKYTGLNFERRSVQQYTLDKHYPPNPYDFKNDTEWENSFLRIFKHCINVPLNKLTENDYDFIVVAFHDEKDETLNRQDMHEDEINRLRNDSSGIGKIWREFNTKEKPKYWVVWPHSKSKGWCDRLIGDL
jgi:hypothetical protein